jgi:hypothetical protein
VQFPECASPAGINVRPRRRIVMADKSPKKNTDKKKATRTLKEKRAEKRAKGGPS